MSAALSAQQCSDLTEYKRRRQGGCHTINIKPSQYQNIKIVDDTSAMLLAAKDAYDRLSERLVSDSMFAFSFSQIANLIL